MLYHMHAQGNCTYDTQRVRVTGTHLYYVILTYTPVAYLYTLNPTMLFKISRGRYARGTFRTR